MSRKSTTLAGKTALVTGAAKRIGRATALALASEGAHVVVHYRSSGKEAEQVASTIRKRGVEAWTIQADLADRHAAEALLAGAREGAGPIDILVNSASVFPTGTLADMTIEDIALNMQVNAIAPFIIARCFAAQGREGSVVNLLDTRIVDYDAAHTAYHMSKRMLFTLTRMMALEFAPSVRVNAVAPGLILPPPGKDDAFGERMTSRTPLQRVGDIEDVTDATLFLLRSEFVTGQVIFVDGGFHMKGSVYGC